MQEISVINCFPMCFAAMDREFFEKFERKVDYTCYAKGVIVVVTALSTQKIPTQKN